MLSVDREVADRTQDAVALRGVAGEAQLILPRRVGAGAVGVTGAGAAGRGSSGRV